MEETWKVASDLARVYIRRRRQQCGCARARSLLLLLCPSLLPHPFCDCARTFSTGNCQIECRTPPLQPPPKILLGETTEAKQGNTQWKEYYGFRPSLAKCDTQKGVKGPRNPVRRGKGEGEDNEPNLWEAFAPRSHKSQPIMVKSTIG